MVQVELAIPTGVRLTGLSLPVDGQTVVFPAPVVIEEPVIVKGIKRFKNPNGQLAAVQLWTTIGERYIRIEQENRGLRRWSVYDRSGYVYVVETLGKVEYWMDKPLRGIRLQEAHPLFRDVIDRHLKGGGIVQLTEGKRLEPQLYFTERQSSATSVLPPFWP